MDHKKKRYQDGGMTEEEFDLLQNAGPEAEMVLPPLDIEGDSPVQEINKEAESPYQQTKSERTAQAVKNDELSLQDKYKALMDQYEKEQKKEVEQPGVMDALPDILTGLYNIGVRANPTGLRELKMPNSVEKARQRSQGQKAQKLQSIDNTRKMVKDLMQLQNQQGKVKNTYKVGDQIVERQDDGSFKPVFTAPKTEELTLQQKEETKAEAKAGAQERKENREERRLAVKALPKLNQKLKQIEAARKALNKYDKSLNPGKGTGFFQGMIPTTSKEGQSVQANFNKLALDEMATIFSGMSKAIDSDAERAFFEKTQPSMSNDESVNRELLANLESRLIQNKKILESQIKNITPKGELKEDPAKEVMESKPLAKPAPYGDVVTRKGRKYKWNPTAGKYQLLND